MIGDKENARFHSIESVRGISLTSGHSDDEKKDQIKRTSFAGDGRRERSPQVTLRPHNQCNHDIYTYIFV